MPEEAVTVAVYVPAGTFTPPEKLMAGRLEMYCAEIPAGSPVTTTETAPGAFVTVMGMSTSMLPFCHTSPAAPSQCHDQNERKNAQNRARQFTHDSHDRRP